jgi:exodeoxyribonuclease VII large subunit
MKVVVTATPKLTPWGKFSVTVKHITPLGEGSLKRNFELLVAKLDKEGLFDGARKRFLPKIPSHIGVVASVDSAGYADFIKILNERWGGMSIDVHHVSVQGAEAPENIISALQSFNEQAEPPELIAIMRGGGSADDLAAFNDEPLTRAIATSRVPIITGIGHEVDTTLADMAADVRAATPSNVAQLIVPDKKDIHRSIRQQQKIVAQRIFEQLRAIDERILYHQKHIRHTILSLYQNYESKVNTVSQQVAQLNPEKILQRGYALVRNTQGKIVPTAKVGETLLIETALHIMTTEVHNVKKR